MNARRVALMCFAAVLLMAALPASALAASTSWGVLGSLSPRFDAPPDRMTRFTITTGGQSYAFRAHGVDTVFYLKRKDSTRFVRVSRNSFVRAMQHHDVNPDPGGRVTRWSWRSSDSGRYRYARVVYGDQN